MSEPRENLHLGDTIPNGTARGVTAYRTVDGPDRQQLPPASRGRFTKAKVLTASLGAAAALAVYAALTGTNPGSNPVRSESGIATSTPQGEPPLPPEVLDVIEGASDINANPEITPATPTTTQPSIRSTIN